MSGGIGSADMDMDMDMDMSTGAVIVTGGATVRPIGVSPALATVPDQNGIMEDWFHGYKWPPADFQMQWVNASPPGNGFPRKYWDPKLFAITVLGEFVLVKTPGGQPAWTQFATALDNLLPKNKLFIDAELAQLVKLIEYRPGVMSEALAQLTNPWAYFRGILMCNASSAPATHTLVEIATLVGQFQAMHYKRHFNRPRPSQYSPALLPPIDVPGHASYPSGHATESMLIALCLEKVMPVAADTPTLLAGGPAPDGPPPPQPGKSPLQQLASRIARNREVLGLHFPSDSKAGRLLAQESFRILTQCPSIGDPTNGLIAKARLEWWP
jgi:membrane-associated phospholipid phosphatase